MGTYFKYGLLIIVLLLLSGCDSYKQDSFKPEYSVTAYLAANDEMPQIRLTQTTPAKNDGTTSATDVSDAHITVSEVGSNGSVISSVLYQYGGGNTYKPASAQTVTPGATYQLNIDIPSTNHQMQAECIIPGSFHVKTADSAPAKYQQTNGIKLLSTPSSYPGREGYYVIAALSQQSDTANLTPYYANKVATESYTPTSSLMKISSQIFNAGDFQKDSNGNLIMTVPWEIFAFYGENQLVVYALDDNTYDYLRSLDVQYSSTQVTPGQLYNLIYHVQGGIGLFGGIATDTVTVTITR